MFYERKIKYLDYYVNQERCGNAGFLKLEARDKICNITVNLSNLRASDSFPVKVYLIGNGQEQELCSVNLLQGKGVKQLLRLDMHDIGCTGISYEALEAVRIPISAEREICGTIGEPKDTAGNEEKVADDVELRIAESEEINTVLTQESEARIAETEEINTVLTQEPEEEELCEQKHLDFIQQQEDVGDRKIPLYDDKWKQLWEIYPHIAPFRDEREYLSLGLNDFVLLPGKYFRMANNSFLLHGFYNYKHLILKKMEYRGEVRYYIGVPGNFYDREKQVAVMFGFESFEGLEEPARTGDYGYYLMRIEL